MKEVYLIAWRDSIYDFAKWNGTAGIYSTPSKAITKAKKMLIEDRNLVKSVIVYEVTVDEEDNSKYRTIFYDTKREIRA